MTDLRELYQEVILDHGRRPRNFSAMPEAHYCKEGHNPLCGDKVTVYLILTPGQRVEAVTFQGSGCAISMASASLMTEAIKGKTLDEVKTLFNNFHQMVTLHVLSETENLGKLAVLAGVAEYPARVKCATLAWHTLLGAIEKETKPITTE